MSLKQIIGSNNKENSRALIISVCALCAVFLLNACENDTSVPAASAGGGEGSILSAGENLSVSFDEETSAYRTVEIPSNVTTVNITGLTGQKVYMAKMNAEKSGEITAEKTRYVISSTITPSSVSSSQRSASSDETAEAELSAAEVSVADRTPRFTPIEHPSSREPIPEELLEARSKYTTSSARTAARSSTETAVEPLAVGTVENKYIDTSYWTDSEEKKHSIYTSQSCVLAAVGGYCYVWVAAQYFDSADIVTGGTGNAAVQTVLTSADAEAIKTQFDSIVPKMRSLLGSESNIIAKSTGDVTLSDPRINIVLFDILGDYEPDQSGGVLGYFYSRDYHYGTESNQGKYFYMDSYFVKTEQKMMYSTAVHEFQHMIYFSRKYWDGAVSYTDFTSADWHNEMMSMLAEDVMMNHLDFSEAEMWDYGPFSRLYRIYPYYWKRSLTDFDSDTTIKTLEYAVVYAFGAYLARNYGGAEFFKAMMDSNSVGISAVEYALSVCGHTDEDFNSVFHKYAEALLFTDPTSVTGQVSFNNTVESTISGLTGATTYTFTGFDISKDKYTSKETSEFVTKDNKLTTYSVTQHNLPGYAQYQVALPYYGFSLHTRTVWKEGVSGSLSMTLSEDSAGEGGEVYLIFVPQQTTAE